MSVTVTLPLSAPLGVGRIVAVDEEASTARIRDLTTGVAYLVPRSVLPDLGVLPWRGRVAACTVIAAEEGVTTDLVLDAVPVPGSAAPSGSAVALEGASRAAAAAKAQAAVWGGTDRPPQEEQPHFW
ncbi:hypothetical protein [Microbacterium sp. 22242]|uniref:hypothetical protein n=1 Tax=Microbacterium sp. 22242 TaxID=3453896 RepID=UPI003F835633